jgi:hypothetical protein
VKGFEMRAQRCEIFLIAEKRRLADSEFLDELIELARRAACGSDQIEIGAVARRAGGEPAAFNGCLQIVIAL